MTHPIRVLVCDDSAFMRRAIARMLTAEDDIEIVGSVGDGAQCLEAVKTLAPDVVTLDIEMPVMDGLTALKRLKETSTVPVIMMSTLTQDGAAETLAALSYGAFDFVPKPEGSMLDVFEADRDLREKVRAAAHSRRRSSHVVVPPPAPVAPPPRPAPARRTELPEMVGIGISTGGPPALQALFEKLPEAFPVGIAVVQHMPPGFTRPLAERLNRICPMTIREAVDGDRILPRTALIAPAGMHMIIKREHGALVCRLVDTAEQKTWHKPSVDVMFASIAKSVGAKALGLIMTGMGNDGTAGAGAMKRSGAEIWSQDEATSVVYGMPRTVYESGVVDRVLPLAEIAPALRHMAGLP